MTPEASIPTSRSGASHRRRLRLVAVFAAVLLGLPLLAVSPAHAATGLTRLHWSANVGRIDVVGPWVRNLTFTFTPTSATSGTAHVAMVQYDPSTAGQKVVAGTAGPCNGVASCPIYRPVPSVTTAWTGSYTFSGSQENVGLLAITWSNGNTESWRLTSLRGGTLGGMEFVSAAYHGSDPNRGIGFGSKQPMSYYKTMGAVDSIPDLYYGSYDRVVKDSSADLDQPWNLNVGGMNGSAQYPKGLYMVQSPDRVNTRCREDLQHIKGNIYMMFVNNASRTMVQNNWFRCLVQAETGAYHGGMHIAMLNQVIDDHKNMVGVVGIESAPSGGWTLALIHALKE